MPPLPPPPSPSSRAAPAAASPAAPADTGLATGSQPGTAMAQGWPPQAHAWSARQQLIGEAVHSDSGERLGEVHDLIVALDQPGAWIILGHGGVLGVGQRLVALPLAQLHAVAGVLLLPGLTPQSLRAMPAFHPPSAATRRAQALEDARQELLAAEVRLSMLGAHAAGLAQAPAAPTGPSAVLIQEEMARLRGLMTQLQRASGAHWPVLCAALDVGRMNLRRVAGWEAEQRG